jgi:immune inhibitor A
MFALVLASGAAVAVGGEPAPAAPADEPPAIAASPASDDLSDPLETKRRESRKTALNLVLNGKAKVEARGASTVVKVGSKTRAGQTGTARRIDEYVELGRETTDKIFVVLVEFGDERHEDFPDRDTDPNTPGPFRFDGPRHNQIPEPDRTVNNTTIWQSDYPREHFENLYFGTGEQVESLKTYYERQSSGRYSVDGRVTDWVKVRYNEARYGRSNGSPCAFVFCDNMWHLVADAVGQHEAGQPARRDRRAIAFDAALRDVADEQIHASRVSQGLDFAEQMEIADGGFLLPAAAQVISERVDQRRPVLGSTL